jgi:heme exporter protein C
MRRLFTPLALVAAAMFAYAPFLIDQAPYESTMLLVQKIFYFHAPSGMVMLTSALICGAASVWFLWKKAPAADRLAVAAGELTVVFGAIVLATGPLWARKAWGVWWNADVRLTMTLVGWLIGCGYLIVRRFGGPGSEKLAAGLAVFGCANVPFMYVSVNVWRTMHPKTSVVPSLEPGMRGPFWFSVLAMFVLYSLLMAARVHLERQRAAVDELYLADEDV